MYEMFQSLLNVAAIDQLLYLMVRCRGVCFFLALPVRSNLPFLSLRL